MPLDSGHYCVVSGYTPTHIIVQDPSFGEREIPNDDFLRRWRDQDKTGRKFIRFGICFPQDEPAEFFEDAVSVLTQPMKKTFIGHAEDAAGHEHDSATGRFAGPGKEKGKWSSPGGKLLKDPHKLAKAIAAVALRVPDYYGKKRTEKPELHEAHKVYTHDLWNVLRKEHDFGDFSFNEFKQALLDAQPKMLWLGRVDMPKEEHRTKNAVSTIEHGNSTFQTVNTTPLLHGHNEKGERFAEADPPAGPAPLDDQVALAGPDGAKATQLLASAKRKGMHVLHEVAASALKRLLASGNPQEARRLFTVPERQRLMDVLAATRGTAELLGRSRIRLRQAAHDRHSEAIGRGWAEFVEEPGEATDFSRFDEGDTLHPMHPERALAHFQSLIPTLRTDPEYFARTQNREAFVVAVATERELLEKLQFLIGDILKTGRGVGTGPETIQALLDEAGVTPRNPQYAENVMRSNLMNQFNRGTTLEMQEPDMAEEFPVWQWLGIDDGRQRPSHEVHFNRFFPNAVPYEEVRDSVLKKYDGHNDRCTPNPIHRSRWKQLQAQGARIAEGWER